MVAWRRNKKNILRGNGPKTTVKELAKSFIADYNSLKGHIAEFFLKQLFFHRLKLPIEETGVAYPIHGNLSGSTRASFLIRRRRMIEKARIFVSTCPTGTTKQNSPHSYLHRGKI